MLSKPTGTPWSNSPGTWTPCAASPTPQASVAQVEGLTRPDAGFYDTLRAILEVNPDDVAALKLLGEDAAITGKTAQARDYWTRLRDALPEDSPDRAEVEQRLKQLGD